MSFQLEEKILSVPNLLSFETDPPKTLSDEEVCRQVYEIGQEFIRGILDYVYSDGPIYFQRIIRTDIPEEADTIVVFTNLGNQVDSSQLDSDHLSIEKDFLLNSQDFTTLSVSELSDYYALLQETYQQATYIAVYHVLYLVEDKVQLDVYSEVE